MSNNTDEAAPDDDSQDPQPEEMHLDPPEYDKVQESGKTEQFTNRDSDDA